MATNLSLDQVLSRLFQDDPYEFGLSDSDSSEDEGDGKAGDREMQVEEISALNREVGGSGVSRLSENDLEEEGLEMDSIQENTSGKVASFVSSSKAALHS